MNKPSQRSTIFATPWFSLVAREFAEGRGKPFYAVEAPDYVAALSVTVDGKVILGRQYRPAVEDWVLGLPSGTVETGEDPEVAMIREIREETGYRPVSVISLGMLLPDVGRLDVRQHCFFAMVEPDPEPLSPDEGEIGLEVVILNLSEFLMGIGTVEGCRHSLDLAVLFLAAQRGLIKLS